MERKGNEKKEGEDSKASVGRPRSGDYHNVMT